MYIQDFAGIYPSDAIERIRACNEPPIILGYQHILENVESIKNSLTELRRKCEASRFKVAHEIAQESLGWLRDFLRDETEFDRLGTIRSKKPTDEKIRLLRAYRRTLTADHSGSLALWMIEQGYEVHSLEHTDVRSWARADSSVVTRELHRMAYTAIRRDIHALKIIALHEPHVVTCGIAHAFKFELLLERHTQHAFLAETERLEILAIWETVHRLYQEHQRCSA